RLLHHVAGLAGDRQVALAGHRRDLDRDDLAADFACREADREAKLAAAEVMLEDILLRPEEIFQRFARDDDLAVPVGLPAHDHRGDLARETGDLAIEPAHSSLARIVADQLAPDVVRDLDRVLGQAAALELAAQQVATRNLDLLVLGAAGHLRRLHPRAWRPRDVGRVTRAA